MQLAQVNPERQGYNAVTADDGRQARVPIAESMSDTAMCDVMMPCVDGFHVMHRPCYDMNQEQSPIVEPAAATAPAPPAIGFYTGQGLLPSNGPTCARA